MSHPIEYRYTITLGISSKNAKTATDWWGDSALESQLKRRMMVWHHAA